MTKIKFLNEFCNHIIEMIDRKIVTPKGDYYKVSTIRNYKVSIYSFQMYEKYLRKSVNLDEIDLKWCEDFRLFLLNKNYAKNSISNTMSNLKAFLKRCYNKGKTNFDGRGIVCPTEITTAVYSTIEDLRKLKKIDLPSGMARIRDVYICQCFLGLRMSDAVHFIVNIKRYTKEIGGNIFFEIKTSKTGEVVVIPAANVVLEIAESRNYDFGKKFSQQYYCKTIKEIIRNSEIDRDVIHYITKGGVLQENIVRYSDLIGTHSARRTFATNAYLSGLNPLDIMKITGHRSYSSFIRYIRCENIAVALQIADHKFFKTEI